MLGKNLNLQLHYLNSRFQKRLFSDTLFSKWFLVIAWIMVGSLVIFIIMIKLIGFLLSLGVYEDPFSTYTMLMPGQPISEINHFHCDVLEQHGDGHYSTPSDQFSCVIFIRDRYFDTLNIDAKDNIITALTFYTTHINLGQLLLAWKPDIRPHITPITVRWNSHGYSDKAIKWNTSRYLIQAYETSYRYETPVRVVMIIMQP